MTSVFSFHSTAVCRAESRQIIRLRACRNQRPPPGGDPMRIPDWKVPSIIETIDAHIQASEKTLQF